MSQTSASRTDHASDHPTCNSGAGDPLAGDLQTGNPQNGPSVSSRCRETWEKRL